MKAKTGFTENCSDRLTLKKGTFRSRISNLFLIILLGLFFVSAMTIPVLMSLQSALSSFEPATAAHLQSLVTDTHPTAYLIQGEITTSGEGAPVVAICDAVSVNMLYGNNPALSQVELVKITATSISVLPSSIDMAQLEELPNLRYLLVEFAFDACGGGADDCLASIVEGIMQGTSSQVTVIYSPSIPQ